MKRIELTISAPTILEVQRLAFAMAKEFGDPQFVQIGVRDDDEFELTADVKAEVA